LLSLLCPYFHAAKLRLEAWGWHSYKGLENGSDASYQGKLWEEKVHILHHFWIGAEPGQIKLSGNSKMQRNNVKSK
jgi:hypothetical protein